MFTTQKRQLNTYVLILGLPLTLIPGAFAQMPPIVLGGPANIPNTPKAPLRAGELPLEVLILQPLKFAELVLKVITLSGNNAAQSAGQVDIPTQVMGPTTLKLSTLETPPAALATLNLAEIPYGPLGPGVAQRIFGRVFDLGPVPPATVPQYQSGNSSQSMSALNSLAGVSNVTSGLGSSLGLTGLSTLTRISSLVNAAVQLQQGQSVNVGIGGGLGGGLGTGIQDFSTLTNGVSNLGLPGLGTGR